MKIFAVICFICVFALSVFAQIETINPKATPQPTPQGQTVEEIGDIDIDIEISDRFPLVRVTGKVTDVHDGDTIRMVTDSKELYKCRFNGIDAPELKQDFGRKSKESLSDLIFGKVITIEYDKIDKYGRNVCKILLDGKDINLEQIRRGMAWHYKKYQDEQSETDRKLYSEAEEAARQNKLGLWVQPNATEPSQWRRGLNNPNLDGVPVGAIIGNTNSMVYHTPGCSSYAKVSPQNRKIFKTEKEAIEKGYRISGQCTSNLPKEEQPKKDNSPKVYQKGSRGGCFYINSSGRKVYVDKSLCQ